MDAAADAAIQAHSLDYYYENESQQTRFSCDQCSSVEDILGELGFCSYCGAFNGKQHVAKRIIVLREKLKAANTPSDVLREAVSIFDATTRKYVENLVRFVPLSRRRRSMFADKSFHDIIRVSQDMRDAFDIDILKDFTRSDQQSLARMFARRHLYEHRGGAVDKIYIDRTGEKTLRIGQVIRDNQGDIQRFLSQLSRIFERMHNGFHELIPHDAKES